MSISAELWDVHGCVIAVCTEGMTQGQARAFFARECDVDFLEVRLRREWFYDSPEYRAEMEADGIEDPYDGYLLMPCAPGAPGAREFWVLAQEDRCL